MWKTNQKRRSFPRETVGFHEINNPAIQLLRYPHFRPCREMSSVIPSLFWGVPCGGSGAVAIEPEASRQHGLPLHRRHLYFCFSRRLRCCLERHPPSPKWRNGTRNSPWLTKIIRPNGQMAQETRLGLP